MPTYDVRLKYVAYYTYSIEAKDEDAAEEIALAKADNWDFDDGDVDVYDVAQTDDEPSFNEDGEVEHVSPLVLAAEQEIMSGKRDLRTYWLQ